MNEPAHDELNAWLGAYLLGALDAHDDELVARHLSTCATCSQDLATLAHLPPRLATLTTDDAATLEPDPASAERFLITALARQRTRRRTERFWQAVAVAAVIVTIASFVNRTTRPTEPTGLAFATIDNSAATGSVAPLPKPWGTELRLTARQLPPGNGYKLWTTDRSGHREVAATWSPSPTNTYHVTGATSIATRDLARIQITTTDDQPLLARDT